MSKSSESKIDRLRRRLNSQNQSGADTAGGNLSRKNYENVNQGWEHEEDEFQYDEPEKKKKGSFLNKLLIFSGIFFLLAFAFAVYSIGFNNTVISPDNVAINIIGPTSISAGDNVSLDIEITNENRVLLQDAELVITYPDGTRQPTNSGEQLSRVREGIGVIPPGETTRYTAESSMFGRQGDRRPVSVSLEYRVQDSNAIFSASKEYVIEISEAPISVRIDSPTEVTANEPFTLVLRVGSNASRVLNDVVLDVTYPFGFDVTEADPEADYRNYIWELGDLSPGDNQEIELTGLFTDSSASAEQAFRFDVGTAQANDSTLIGTLFASEDITVNLREPYINVDTEIRTSRSSDGSQLNATGRINWRSNLDSTVRGGEVRLSLSGTGIDYDTLSSGSGLFRPDDQEIVWNGRTNSELQNISPGDSGTMRFEFTTERSETLVSLADSPTAIMDVLIQAQSSDSSSLPNPVTANVQRELRLPTVAGGTISTLYDDGPFTNSGPVPPEVNETTSYTVHFSLSNTTNEIQNARLQAALPAYVDFSGVTSPGNADISYNDISGRLTWDIGTIPAGAGYTTAPKEAFIQVEVRPAPRNTGSVLRILEDISITGTDTHTEESVQIRDLVSPTTERNDLRATSGSGQVQN